MTARSRLSLLLKRLEVPCSDAAAVNTSYAPLQGNAQTSTLLPTAPVSARSTSSAVQQQSHESSTSFWAAAGVAACLLQGARIAHADNETSSPQEAMGNKSTAQWRLYTNMGHSHYRKGDRAKAEQYLYKALEEAKKGFGERDGHVAAALNNLAELHRTAGQYDLAEPLYKESLELLEANYGREDPRTATALQHMAGFYQQQMRWAQARSYSLQAVQAVSASLGPQHPVYARALSQLADLERMMDDKAAAIALLRQVKELLDAQGPTSAAEAVVAANKLGQLLVMDGQDGAGVAALRGCVAQAEALGEGPQRAFLVPFCLGSLAEALQQTGDLEGARELYHKSIGLRSGHGAHSSSLPELLVGCADLEMRLGRTGGGRDCFLRAHNLAQQAVERHTDLWERLTAAVGKPQGGGRGSTWSLLPSRKAQKTLEPSGLTASLCQNRVKAYLALAAAQEELGRASEATRTLLEALDLLESPASLPRAVPDGRLDLDDRQQEPWREAVVQHLQLVVEVLFALTKLLGAEPGTDAGSRVEGHLSTLRGRLPGLVAAGEADAAPSLAAQTAGARQRLNSLQSEMNRRRRESVAEARTRT